MHTTHVNSQESKTQRGQSKRRFGFGFAWLAAALVMAPAQFSTAQSAAPPAKADAPPAAASPAAATVGLAASAPASAPTAAPTAPPAAPPPKSGVFKRVEVYGNIFSSVSRIVTLPAPPGAKPWQKKPTEKRTTSTTILSLVVTTSDPLPIGNTGILYRKVEKPGDLASTQWLKIADLTLKKIDPTGKMTFDVNAEEKDVLVNGKKEDHFKKGTRIKVQIDVEIEKAP